MVHGTYRSLLLALSIASPSFGQQIAKVDTPTGHPPSDAVVIFDGTTSEHLVKCDGRPCDWPIENGALVVPCRQRENRGLWTKFHFRDAQIHVEFQTPTERRQRGNSGLYFHGIAELQIYDAEAAVDDPQHTIGSVYGIAAPLVNAGRPAGKWQSYDIVFIAPRRNSAGEDGAGQVVRPGTITALLNGVVVQKNAQLSKPLSRWAPMTYNVSPYTARVNEHIRRTEAGPLYLQDHDAPVRFRNIWIRPLDDRASWFK